MSVRRHRLDLVAPRRRRCACGPGGRGRRPRLELRGGFSLAEVSVAMGIFAIAVLPMMALLSMGTEWGRDSAIESRAAFLARSLMDDLRNHETTGEARLLPDVTLPRFEPKLIGFDAFGQPLKLKPASYEEGDRSGNIIYLARVSGDVPDASIASLARIEIAIEHPGYRPAAERNRFTFYALVRAESEEETPPDETPPPAS